MDERGKRIIENTKRYMVYFRTGPEHNKLQYIKLMRMLCNNLNLTDAKAIVEARIMEFQPPTTFSVLVDESSLGRFLIKSHLEKIADPSIVDRYGWYMTGFEEVYIPQCIDLTIF